MAEVSEDVGEMSGVSRRETIGASSVSKWAWRTAAIGASKVGDTLAEADHSCGSSRASRPTWVGSGWHGGVLWEEPTPTEEPTPGRVGVSERCVGRTRVNVNLGRARCRVGRRVGGKQRKMIIGFLWRAHSG